MTELPLELCAQLQAQWRGHQEDLHIPYGAHQRVDKLLKRLDEHIRVCDSYDLLQKPMAGEYAAAEYGNSFLGIPGIVRLLQREFEGIVLLNEGRHPQIEEANILVSLLILCRDSMKEAYRYPDKAFPPKPQRKGRIRNEHPEYPIYPPGQLNGKALGALQEARATLLSLAEIDQTILKLSKNDPELVIRLLKQCPQAISFIGTERDQSWEQVNTKLQAAFAEAYNQGVCALTHGHTMEDAEFAMSLDYQAIQNFCGQPKELAVKGAL